MMAGSTVPVACTPSIRRITMHDPTQLRILLAKFTLEVQNAVRIPIRAGVVTKRGISTKQRCVRSGHYTHGHHRPLRSTRHSTSAVATVVRPPGAQVQSRRRRARRIWRVDAPALPLIDHAEEGRLCKHVVLHIVSGAARILRAIRQRVQIRAGDRGLVSAQEAL